MGGLREERFGGSGRGGENESEGWGEWRKRARDGGTAGREIWREWEGRMRARDGGVEKEGEGWGRGE